MAYSCFFDDEITKIIKQKAEEQDRTIRGQIMHYLKSAIQNEKTDAIRQDKPSVLETSNQFTLRVNL